MAALAPLARCPCQPQFRPAQTVAGVVLEISLSGPPSRPARAAHAPGPTAVVCGSPPRHKRASGLRELDTGPPILRRRDTHARRPTGRDEIVSGSLPFIFTGDQFSAPCNNNHAPGPTATKMSAYLSLAVEDPQQTSPDAGLSDMSRLRSRPPRAPVLHRTQSDDLTNLLQSQEVTPSSHHSIMRWLLESASVLRRAFARKG
jgi:hypothetical protein